MVDWLSSGEDLSVAQLVLGSTVLASVMGAATGTLVQQLFAPREARVEARAELRRSVVEEQYESLERLRLLAETGLKRGTFRLGTVRVRVTPEGEEIDRDTVAVMVPQVLEDSALQARWRRLAKEVEDADEVSPRVRETYRSLRQMVDSYGWSEADSVIGTRWDHTRLQRWISLNERLRTQVDALLSLEF